MTNREVLKAYIILKLVELYGIEYLKNKIKNCWNGISEEEDKCRFIYLFEGTNGENEGLLNKKGWKVYAIIDIDKNTFETTLVEYTLPDKLWR